MRRQNSSQTLDSRLQLGKSKKISLVIFFLVSSIWSLASFAHATSYQQCQASSTCTLGEFLYNDDSSPLPGQSCTLTAKYPDGTTLFTSVPMTSRPDGWYSYDATLGTTSGLYTASMCCTPPGGTMCLDKSFEVEEPSGSSLTAAAIWNYSDRTLTGYGTLVSDIWSYSSRSLTSFGSLVSDIWSYSNKTLSSFDFTSSSTPAPSTLQNIVAEQTKQRELLEKLVNAPVVTLTLADGPSPDLSIKLDESKKQAALLYDMVQSTRSKLLTLDSKWTKLESDAILSQLTNISEPWTDPSAIVALSNSWNTRSVDQLVSTAAQLKSDFSALIASSSQSQLYTAIDSLTKLETELGDTTASSGDHTFYGYLASVKDRAALLDTESQKLAATLEDWDGTGEALLAKDLKSTQSRLLTINEFPGGESILAPSNSASSGKAALKNLLFSLQGLISLNKIALASPLNAPIRGLWLEEGSIIFRAVVNNPSALVTQTAPLKFTLPKELKSEDIITIDPALSASYDPSEDALVVTGSFELKPLATRIVAVEVKDIWQLSDAELTAIKTKASSLLSSMNKSPLLSQALVLKSNIDSSIDKLLHAQNSSVKPENRIKNFREANLALATTNTNMTQLENLVAEATSSSSLMGFVGGVSTTAVFGIILVVVAGFIFMSIYFKKIAPLSVSVDAPVSPAPLKLSRLEISSSDASLTSTPAWQMPALIAAVVVATALTTVVLTRLASHAATPPSVAVISQPSPTSTPTPTPTPTPTSSLPYILQVPPDSTVNIRNKPSSTADIIMALKDSVGVVVFKEDGEWRQIGFSDKDLTKGYWVNSKFIIEQ